MSPEASVISMRDVNHFYGVGALRRQVLFNVTCDIRPGEIVIITGPSGSGKTTVLTLAGALRSVQAGSMKILGQELKGASNHALVRIRESIGFIFQMHNLLDCLSARQNVEMSLGVRPGSSRESRARATTMLKAVGLGDRLDYPPSKLSGGQRQRVAVARALVRQPKIVLADEPTAALDKQSGREVVEILRQLARREGCAVLMVTHDSRILDVADRIMLLEDGHLESFRAAISPHAVHLLTALSFLPDPEHLKILWGPMTEAEFVELLRALTGEVEQFLNVLDMGGQEATRQLFCNLLEAVLGKAMNVMLAEGASILTLRDGELKPAVMTGDPLAVRPDVACRAFERGEIVMRAGEVLGAGVRSVLCVPLRNRRDDILGVAQLVNKNGTEEFTQADQRSFLDLRGGLERVLEGYDRVGLTN